MKDYQNWLWRVAITDKHIVLLEMKNKILKLKSQSGVNSRLDPIEDSVEERISELEEKYKGMTNNSAPTRT